MKDLYSYFFILLIIIIGFSCIAEPVLGEKGMVSDLPDIHILATGGTIAGTAQNQTELTHYTAGKLGIKEMIQSVPDVEMYANLTGEQICNLPSDDITPEIWLMLADRVNEILADPKVNGVVITHGTDTLEDTAYFLNLVVKSEKPIIITGAMRPATALSSDGPLNLLNSVRLAGNEEAKGKGVLIAMNGEINGARDTSKTHTTDVETFRSPDFGLLGIIDNGIPHFYRQSTKLNTLGTEFDISNIKSLPKVDIVTLYPGMDTTAIDSLVANGTKGLVIGGLGNGGYSKSVGQTLVSLAKKGLPIVVSSRTGNGITTPDDPELISADSLTPQKARILLMLALTETSDKEKIAEMFRKY